jgi:tRNA G18 (ribose-2'-O)-methylase SpoU
VNFLGSTATYASVGKKLDSEYINFDGVVKMGQVTQVIDPEDPCISDYVRLTDADWRARTEAEHGMFVAEGHFVVGQVLQEGHRFRSVLVSSARADALGDLLDHVDAPVYVATQAVIDAVAGYHAHRGLLAAVERPAPRTVDDLARLGGHLLVVEDVSDHENVGALFRNAAAFGMGGVILSSRCCDPLYRRAVRVSMGHVLSVPWAFAAREAWPPRLPDHEIVALTPSADAEPLDAAKFALRVALMVGSEGPGLSPAALAAADRRVCIRMAPGVDSLNVATAAAVAMSRLT